jgi:hypothetical protein
MKTMTTVAMAATTAAATTTAATATATTTATTTEPPRPGTVALTGLLDDPMVRLALRHDEGEPDRSSLLSFGSGLDPIGAIPSSVSNPPTSPRSTAATIERSSMPSSPVTETRSASWSSAKAHRSSGHAIESSAISMRPRTQPRRHS